jgi:thiol-disulfide isomerase/thioredoxin
MNGSQADRYAYDGDGDYYSVLDVTGGKIRVVIDPKAMPRSQSVPPGIEFDAAHQEQMVVQEVQSVFSDAYHAWVQEMFAASGGPAAPADTQQRLDAATARLEAWESDATAPVEARRLALVRRQDLYRWQHDRSTAAMQHMEKLLDTIPPESPLWRQCYYLLSDLNIFPGDPTRYQAPVRRIFDSQQEHEVRGEILGALLKLAGAAHDQAEVERLYADLKANYSDLESLAFLLARFNPEPPLAAGKPFPDFKAPLLDGSGDLNTHDFRGHYLLIDFWATWCKPCVEAVPALEEMWRKYRDRGLKVVGVSLDQGSAEVDGFRRTTKSGMPWAQTRLPGGLNNPLLRRLGIFGIPNMVLVDPEGSVVISGAAPLIEHQLQRRFAN